MVICIAAAMVVLAHTVVICLVRGQVAVRTAHIEGQRAALKQAIDAARERADVAVLTSPKGNLTTGLLRAQMAWQLELDIRDLLAKVK